MPSEESTAIPTLIERIDNPVFADGTVTFAGPDEHVTISWLELADDARRMAGRLQADGITPGAHVCILGPTNRLVVTAVQAIWRAGGCVVMLPLPMRLASIDAFVAQTRRRVLDADAAMVLIDPEFAPFVSPEPGDPPFVRLDEAAAWDGPKATPVASDLDALAVLQFTSGSTSEPKGVMLTQQAVSSNVAGCTEAGGLVAGDVIVSWLPLYHDMGLIGMLTIPMCTGTSLVLGAPQDFLAKPLRWLEWMSQYRGSITAAPNFAYALGVRALRKAPSDLDLSHMKVVLSGAEPVDGPTFRRFLDAAGKFGMEPAAAYPAFGMAEVCIGGTFPRRGDGLRMDVVDRVALEVEHVAREVDPSDERARELARLGRPVPGLEIRIVDRQDRHVLGEREVGELLIRGSSLTSGYYKRPDLTAELIIDGWLHTGDLAYTVDGELVMCGRIKDVIIIGGRNVYPQDVERAVNEVEGVRSGNAIAFGVDARGGGQSIVVVAETRAGDLETLAAEVAEAVTAEVGIPPKDVVFVRPSTLPKTSSGKLQRSACAAQYASGTLELAEPTPA